MLKTVLLVNHYRDCENDLHFLHGISDLLFVHDIRTIGLLPANENFSSHKDRILTLP